MTRRFLDVSSGQLSPDTWAWLDAHLAGDALRDPANLIAAELGGGRTPSGWFAYAPEAPVNDIPADLRQVFREARRRRADYVLLDSDAPIIPGLPVLHPGFASPG